MLAILGGLAEFERELNPTGDGSEVRQGPWGAVWPAAGRTSAPGGHPAAHGGAHAVHLARTYGVSQATISRLQPSPFQDARRVACSHAINAFDSTDYCNFIVACLTHDIGLTSAAFVR